MSIPKYEKTAEERKQDKVLEKINGIIGCIWCITIVGIPFGLQFFLIAKLSLAFLQKCKIKIRKMCYNDWGGNKSAENFDCRG